MTPRRDDPATRTLRLRFRRGADGLRLLSRERIEATRPGDDDPVAIPAGRAGVWLTLRTASGGIAFRRDVGRFLRDDVELFPTPEEPALSRRPADPSREITFTLLVPDRADARRLEVVERREEPDGLRDARGRTRLETKVLLRVELDAPSGPESPG